MNPVISKIFIFFTSVILPIIIGYVIKKLLKVKKEKLDFLLFINIMLVIPVSIALTFWNMKLNRSMILLPIIGFITPLISGVIGYYLSRKKYQDPKQQGSYILANMLNNRGTIGGLTMFILYGEIGYAYVNLILLFASINVFFIAYPMANYFSNRASSEKRTFKSIVFRKTNLPMAGAIIGIVLNLFANPRPDSITPYIDPLVKCMAWLSLIPVGASIDFHGVKKHIKKTLDIILLRFIIMPLLTAAAAYSLIPDIKMATTLVLISMMPVAINAVVISKLTKLDENVSVSAFLVTTAIYLFVIFPALTIIVA